MNIRKITLVVLGGLLLVACGDKKYKGFQKTENGLYYRFHVVKSTHRVPENDDLLFLEMSIRTEKDSVVLLSKKIPVMMQASRFKGDVYEALSLMHEGDSAEFIINAKKYFDIYNYGQIPDFVKNDETMLWFTIRIDTIQTREQYQLKLIENRLEAEKQSIVNYLTTNNITASPLPSGLYYIETKTGKGKNPAVGQTVKVHYTGRLLNDVIFDASEMRGEPLPFRLGMGEVIKGWDEGIALMKKGGKAILVIPSALAYGEKSVGKIPAYSPLLFEVELVDFQ